MVLLPINVKYIIMKLKTVLQFPQRQLIIWKNTENNQLGRSVPHKLPVLNFFRDNVNENMQRNNKNRQSHVRHKRTDPLNCYSSKILSPSDKSRLETLS